MSTSSTLKKSTLYGSSIIVAWLYTCPVQPGAAQNVRILNIGSCRLKNVCNSPLARTCPTGYNRSFEATEARMLRVVLSGFYDMASVVARTFLEFDDGDRGNVE